MRFARLVPARTSAALALGAATIGVGVVSISPPAANAGAAAMPAVFSTAAQTLNTSYPIPSGAVFVAPSGKDANVGTAAAPLRTLARALVVAPAGGTVVLRGGVYREGSTKSVAKKLTLQNYPRERVWLDGTDVVTGWTRTGTVWSRSWSTPSFCAGKYYTRPYASQNPDNSGPCTHIDMAKDPAYPAAGSPQMVYVNGRYVREVTSRAAVTGATFYYDQAARQLYLGIDPHGRRVEVATRPMALALQGGTGFTIRGIGFRRYATIEHSSKLTHGAVLAGEPNVRLERVVFTEMAGAGLQISDPRGGVVRQSLFLANGFNGINANGHSTSGSTRDGLVVESSMFDGNNRERFGLGCSRSCAAAGMKMAHMNGFTLRGNIFQNARGTGAGFWCDLDCSAGVMVGNVFRNNGGTGLYYEVSDTGIIASNLIHDNGRYGLKVGSANTRIYNNTIAGNATNVLLYDDDRSPGYNGWHDVGPNSRNLSFVNNLVAGGKTTPLRAWRTSSVNGNTGPATFVATMDYNSYFRPANSPANFLEWRDGSTTVYPSLAAFRTAKGKERHGQEFTGADPFFVDAASDNYALRAGSSARRSGVAPPADVAAAVGVPAGTAVDRGALRYPGLRAPGCETLSSPIHSRVNPTTSAQLLTPSRSEADGAGAYGFTEDRGIVFRAALSRQAGLVPVHRLYSAATGDFVWIADPREISTAVTTHGYADQGVNFFALPGGTPCSVPVYRFVRGTMHRYATTATQRSALTASGWREEKVAFHAVP